MFSLTISISRQIMVSSEPDATPVQVIPLSVFCNKTSYKFLGKEENSYGKVPCHGTMHSTQC